MIHSISFNGKILPADTKLVGAESRAIRYGDGLFETIRLHKGELPLFPLHMERLFGGMNLLGFEKEAHVTADSLKNNLIKLAKKNNVLESARIRLNIIRGSGGVYDPESNKPNYILEANPLAEPYSRLNENGLVIGIFPEGWKATDRYCNVKSNNFLPYIMGAAYAKAKHWNEALILNQHGRIAETSLANIFWIEGRKICTPPLQEGGVAGVMRRHLINQFNSKGNPVIEKQLSREELINATAVFLTNAISGIRWVKEFENTRYRPDAILPIYKEMIQTIYQL